MVYTAAGVPHSANAISLTNKSLDRPQRVSVTINGFEYPGEVVFADQWQPWFGSAPPERVMFRLVLLSADQRVDRSDVTDRFIAVAVPPLQEQGSGLDISEFTQLNREIGRLNEIRERYVTSSDSGLQALASTINGQASEAQRNIAGTLAERWRRGEIVTSSETPVQLPADSVFIGDDPWAWVEAIAAAMFTRPEETRHEPDLLTPETLFARIVAGEETSWRTELHNRLSMASGNSLDVHVENLSAMAAGHASRIHGESLRAHLLRQQGLPPGLATLLITAFIRIRDGEAAIASGDPAGNTRLDSHSLSSAVYEPGLIYRVIWLSDRQSGDWNSALHYVRALLPDAAPSEKSEPDIVSARQLIQALQVAESRTALTLRTLNSAVGPGADALPAVSLAKRLLPVLGADSWTKFYALAKQAFPDAAGFAEAVGESARLRALCEDVVDIQAAREYVSAADFGRTDQALATDAELLAARLDVTAILTNRASAAPVLHDFHHWKRRFTRSYLAHHSERRSADLVMQRRVKRADMQHAAVQRLAKIPELADIYDPGFAAHWTELVESVKPCPNREHEVELQVRPYCSDCGVRMGSQGREDEVGAKIAEIEDMLHECSTRLSEIAVSRVLSVEREDELRSLIRINSIADLTAISHVLDDGVMRFLERFASNSSGPAGEPGR